MLLKGIAIGIVVLIFALVFFDAGLITSKFVKPNIPFFNSSGQKQVLVSGVVKINGPIPQGSSISIGVREHGLADVYKIFVTLPAADETPWKYIGAISGNSYEFQAYLDTNGNRSTTSEPLVVTAPAGEEILTLNIETPPAPQPQPASISGVVYINGYIPEGATFDILGRVYGSLEDYSVVVKDLSATVKRTMTYTNAVSGEKYEVIGKLYDSKGSLIGTSNNIAISAPSDNAELMINSSAAPPVGAITVLQNNTSSSAPSNTPTSSALPAGSSAISGTINFNGSAPSGSSIVILATPQGTTQDYQVVVNGITPANGSTWTWNGAAAGTTYNMLAVLKGQQNNQNTDYADSQTYTVAAPANNQLFTLNTGFSLGAPSGPVFPTCSTHNSNNTWDMTVNFTNVTGAQYYVLQLGSTSGGNNVVNASQTAQTTSNNTQQVNATINDSVVYYAQYAVASVTNPTPAQLSPFSGPFTIKCP